jgi:hypothetical protein
MHEEVEAFANRLREMTRLKSGRDCLSEAGRAFRTGKSLANPTAANMAPPRDVERPNPSIVRRAVGAAVADGKEPAKADDGPGRVYF